MPEKKTEGVSLRVMPNSYEAEQAVLAAMLLDNEKCSEFLPGLSEDDFYAVAHKKIFKVITELARESGASVDAIAVMSRLNRKGELDAVGGAGAIESADRQHRFHRQRAILFLHRQARRHAAHHDTPRQRHCGARLQRR